MNLENHEKDILERFKDGFKRKDYKVYMKGIRAQIVEGIARDKHLDQGQLLAIFDKASAWKENLEYMAAQREANKRAKNETGSTH